MTPHIDAELEDIEKIVIMPGDPLRAEYIAKNYLESFRVVSEVRGMNTYTGTYKGKGVTVMPSGMGIPSMGIYSYELFKFYGVEKIIKVGTCGTYTKELDMGDLILVSKSYSESTYSFVQDKVDDKIMEASGELNKVILDTASRLQQKLTEGVIHSSDVFYEEDDTSREVLLRDYGCIACEMESFSLLHNAKKFGRAATEILTVTDNLVSLERLPSEDRQKKVDAMILLALESVLSL